MVFLNCLISDKTYYTNLTYQSLYNVGEGDIRVRIKVRGHLVEQNGVQSNPKAIPAVLFIFLKLM